jgi:hypothetical protein
MSEDRFQYSSEREARIFDWHITNNINAEILVFEGDGIGRCIVIDRMKIAAKILFAGDVVKVSTVEGYSTQISFVDKYISVIKEA